MKQEYLSWAIFNAVEHQLDLTVCLQVDLGAKAVELLMEGKGGRAVGIEKGIIVDARYFKMYLRDHINFSKICMIYQKNYLYKMCCFKILGG